MRISKKKLKAVERAISDSFDETVAEHICESEFHPSGWSEYSVELFEQLHDMMTACTKKVINVLTHTETK